MTRITAKRTRPSPLSPSDVWSEISIRVFCYGVGIARPVGGGIVRRTRAHGDVGDHAPRRLFRSKPGWGRKRAVRYTLMMT